MQFTLKEPYLTDGSDQSLVIDETRDDTPTQEINLVLRKYPDEEAFNDLSLIKGLSVKSYSFDEQQPGLSQPILTPEEVKLMDPPPTTSSDESDDDLVIDENPTRVNYMKYKLKKSDKSPSKVQTQKVQPKNHMMVKPPINRSCFSKDERFPLLDDGLQQELQGFRNGFSPQSRLSYNSVPSTQNPSRSQVPIFNNSYSGPTQFNPPMYVPQPPVFSQPQPMQSSPPVFSVPNAATQIPKPHPMIPEEPQFFSGDFHNNRKTPAAGRHWKDPQVKYSKKQTNPRAQLYNTNNPRVKNKFKKSPIVQNIPSSGRVLTRPPLKRKPVKTLPQRTKTAINSINQSIIKLKCLNKVLLPDIKEKLRQGMQLTNEEKNHLENNPNDFKEEPKTTFNFTVVSSFII